MWTKDSFVLRITRRKGKRKSLIADSTFISTSTAEGISEDVEAGLLVVLRDAASVFNMM